MPQEPTSSFQLPNGETVSIVWVRLANGALVPRSASEVLKRPAPPASQVDAQKR